MLNFLKRHVLLICVLLVMVGLRCSPLLAQTPEDNILDSIVIQYRDAVAPWRTVLIRYANSLFWLLVFIDFTWSSINQVMRRADLSETISDLMRRIMHIGFYLALIQHPEVWTKAIIDSFRQAAANANAALGGPTIHYGPSDIFDAGLQIAIKVTDSLSFLNPGDSFAIGFSALVILVLFAFIAAQILVTLVEMYISLSASVLLMGFGGSSWTREYANKILTYVLSVGIKLFALQLIIGIGQTLIMSWFATYQHSWSQLLVLVGTAVVYTILTITIPNIFQNLVNGVNLGNGGQQLVATVVSGASQAASLGAGTAAQAFGGAMAAKEAFQLAGLKGGQDMGRVEQFFQTAGILGGSALSTLGGKLAGNPFMQQGNWGGRMASDLREQRLKHMSDAESTENQAATAQKEADPSKSTSSTQDQASSENSPSAKGQFIADRALTDASAAAQASTEQTATASPTWDQIFSQHSSQSVPALSNPIDAVSEVATPVPVDSLFVSHESRSRHQHSTVTEEVIYE